MEKELENSEKNKRRKQPKPSQPAQPGRAPAPPERRTRLLAAVLPRALLPSLYFAGPVRQSSSRYPARPFLHSLRRGPYLLVSPLPRSPWTGACALAHVAAFLGHDTRPRT